MKITLKIVNICRLTRMLEVVQFRGIHESVLSSYGINNLVLKIENQFISHPLAFSLAAFWISVIHLFSPFTIIPHASACVFSSSPMCGLMKLW